MKKYKVTRSLSQAQVQIVEANSPEDAIREAKSNPIRFEKSVHGDKDWRYFAEETQ